MYSYLRDTTLGARPSRTAKGVVFGTAVSQGPSLTWTAASHIPEPELKNRTRYGAWLCAWTLALWGGSGLTASAQDLDAGPLYQQFPLTLSPGHRTEALGPFWQHEKSPGQELWGVPPLFSYVVDRELDSSEFDFLYPLFTYDRFGMEYRAELFQVLSQAGGQSQTSSNAHRVTLFPLYFQQRSADPTDNYTAVLPFYGTVKHRLSRDEIHWAMWPLYVESRRRDVVTDNYLFPIFHVRHGDGLSGWQAWPFVGQEHKGVTTRTNHWGDVEVVGGHDKSFVLWPFYMSQATDLGTTNPVHQTAMVPFFSSLRSPRRDSFTAPWPLGYTRTQDREKGYREWGAPWPLVVFSRGTKTTDRVFPFYSKSFNATTLSQWYLWPVYKYNRINAPPLDLERTRIVLFLYGDQIEKNTESKEYRRRTDVWPLFQQRREYDGSTRLQVLAPIEPMLHSSKSVDRNWSPLWSLWRSEYNASTGATSDSLLWNLYRHDTTLTTSRTAFLFGLFQHRQDPQGGHLRLFYVPVTR